MTEDTVNKLILIVCVLALAVSGVNTALLLQMSGKAKEAGQQVEAVAKELEKVQPLLKGLSEKAGTLPDGPPPGPGETTGKPPLPGIGEGGAEPKPPLPRPPVPPLPPGGLPPK